MVAFLAKPQTAVLGLLEHGPSFSHGIKGLAQASYGQTDSVFGSKDKNCSNIVAGELRRPLPLATPGRNGFPSLS